MPSTTFLRGILDYDPLTGVFVWRVRFDVPEAWNTKFAGQKAGSIDADGYWVIRIGKKVYKGHRMAWTYVTGQTLSEEIEIDHRNGVRLDNSFDNLRLANDQQNAVNAKIRRDNHSGAKGVSWHRARSKWQVQINENGRRRNIGYFDDIETARATYQKRAVALHGEFVRAA